MAAARGVQDVRAGGGEFPAGGAPRPKSGGGRFLAGGAPRPKSGGGRWVPKAGMGSDRGEKKDNKGRAPPECRGSAARVSTEERVGMSLEEGMRLNLLEVNDPYAAHCQKGSRPAPHKRGRVQAIADAARQTSRGRSSGPPSQAARTSSSGGKAGDRRSSGVSTGSAGRHGGWGKDSGKGGGKGSGKDWGKGGGGSKGGGKGGGNGGGGKDGGMRDGRDYGGGKPGGGKHGGGGHYAPRHEPYPLSRELPTTFQTAPAGASAGSQALPQTSAPAGPVDQDECVVDMAASLL